MQRSGLLSRQTQALALRRLQAIDWIETALGRIFGRSYLVCRQLGRDEHEAEASRSFSVPGLDRETAVRLPDELVAGAPAERELRRVSPIYRRVIATRIGLVLLGGIGVVALTEPRAAFAVAARPGWPPTADGGRWSIESIRGCSACGAVCSADAR